MAGPPPIAPGLQQLLPLNFVKVTERRSLFKSKVHVTNEAGDRIFTVRESESGLMHQLSGKDRIFNFFDENEHSAVTLRVPSCFLSMSKMEVIISEETVSVVRQQSTFLKPLLSINDANDVPVLRIKGSSNLAWDATYELQSADKTRIGTIIRQYKWAEPDPYHVTFPADLDVRYKATVIGTCLLIEALYHRAHCSATPLA